MTNLDVRGSTKDNEGIGQVVGQTKDHMTRLGLRLTLPAIFAALALSVPVQVLSESTSLVPWEGDEEAADNGEEAAEEAVEEAEEEVAETNDEAEDAEAVAAETDDEAEDAEAVAAENGDEAEVATDVPAHYARAAVSPGTMHNAPGDPANYRTTPGIGGATGLPRMPTAQVGIPRTLRLGLTGEFFAGNDFLHEGDQADRQGLILAAGYSATSWMEAYASVGFVSVSNTLGSPPLMQIQGDIDLGLKAAWPIIPGVAAGADLGVGFFPNIGGTGIGSVGFWPRAMTMVDLLELAEVPLILHANVGMLLDSSDDPTDDWPHSPTEEFALGIHGYDRFAVGAGIEAPLPIATPFLGYQMNAPLGEIVVSGAEGTVNYGELISHVLSLGARVTATRDLTFTAAVDLAVGGRAVDGIPALMPWNLMLGVSYIIDPFGGHHVPAAPAPRTEPAFEPPPGFDPNTGWLTGVVTDAESGEVLVGAVVSIPEAATYPAASNTEGSYRTHRLQEGELEVVVSLTGYEPVTKVASIEAGETTTLDAALERIPEEVAKPEPVEEEEEVMVIEPGVLALSVLCAEEGEPASAEVTIEGDETQTVSTDETGRLEASVPPGEYLLRIAADGFLWRQINLAIEEGEKIEADIMVAPEPEEALVTFDGEEFEMAQRVAFEDDTANLLSESHPVLEQVIDLMTRHKIGRIRVEGHTDNQAPEEDSKRISKARADEVRRYLVVQGIDGDRVETAGLGQDRPVAPNLTQRGRAMNNRIEFHVIEEDDVAEAEEEAPGEA